MHTLLTSHEVVEQHLRGRAYQFRWFRAPSFPHERSLNLARSGGPFSVHRRLNCSTGVFLQPQRAELIRLVGHDGGQGCALAHHRYAVMWLVPIGLTPKHTTGRRQGGP